MSLREVNVCLGLISISSASCSVVMFSVLSFLAGAIHLPIPAKLHPHFHFHLPHFHGGGHGAGHGAAHGGMRGGARGGGVHVSWFNAFTVLAFLAWFGGTGLHPDQEIAPGRAGEPVHRGRGGAGRCLAGLPLHVSADEETGEMFDGIIAMRVPSAR